MPIWSPGKYRFSLRGPQSQVRALLTLGLFVCAVAGCVASPSSESATIRSTSSSREAPPGTGAGPAVVRDGVSVTLQQEVLAVAGKPVSIEVEIGNERTTSLALATNGCGIRLLPMVEVPFPGNPAGETWPGIAGELKDFLLSNHHSGGGVPEDGLLRVPADEASCGGVPEKTVLVAGSSVSASAVWKPEYTPGVPLPAGDYGGTLSIFAGTDAEATATTVNPAAYLPIDLRATFNVAGDGRAPVSAGEAIDAVLSDSTFGDWLAKEPSSTWTAANVFLRSQPVQSGIVPVGPVWEVDVFRGEGRTKEWAISFVGAYNGSLITSSYCAAPCLS